MSSEARAKLIEAIRIAEELKRREEKERVLWDMKAFAEMIFPPEDETVWEFWRRFAEPQEWLLELCLRFKTRATIEVLPGFSVVQRGNEHLVEKPEEYDLSRYRTLLILQSRETLKTSIRRIDFVHDLVFYPEVLKRPAASAWFGHKLDMALGNQRTIEEMILKTDFSRVFAEHVPPPNKDGRLGPSGEFSMASRPPSAPEPSAKFLAVKTAYEGGRYKSGHFDDLCTEDDAVSALVREEKRRNISRRENERDRKYGIRIVQGTPQHPEDAYAWLQKQPGVFTVKLPCLLGNVRAFFDFAALPDDQAREQLESYTEQCKPVFPNLDLWTLRETYHQQEKGSFASQMLLDPSLAGKMVFDVSLIVQVDPSEIEKSWPYFIFVDPALKRPDNIHAGDYTAICVCGFDRAGRRFIVDGVYRDDMNESDLFMELNRLFIEWRPQAIYTEQNSQQDLNQHWQQFAIKNRIPITWITPLKKAGRANKMQRIKALEPYIRTGRLIFVKNTPITEAFIEEAMNYSAVSGPARHDDALDVVAQTLDPAVIGYAVDPETENVKPDEFMEGSWATEASDPEAEIWMP